MEIVDIFVIVKNKLLSVKYDEVNEDEYRLLFNNWHDPEYLEDFFEQNKLDLQHAESPYAHISVPEAIEITIDEAYEFEDYILEISNSKSEVLEGSIFVDLHKDTLSPIHVESKAYGTYKKSWLRIYAIRISTSLYVVVGGGIKLTGTIQQSNHLKRELVKLKESKRFLQELGLFEEDDYDFVELKYDE